MDDELRARYRISRPYNRGPELRRPAHRPTAPRPADPRPNPTPAAASRRPAHIQAQPEPLPAAADLFPAPAVTDQPSHRRHTTQPHYKTARRRNVKRYVLIVSLIIVLLGASGGVWYWRMGLASPIPAATRNSVSFALPYPTKLPAGYHLDPASYTSSRNVVIYSAVSQRASKIVFTVQKRPPKFDFTAFYKDGLTDSTVFAAPAGQAAIGGSEGHLLGSLVTDQSWLLVSPSSNNLQSDDLRLTLNGVKISNR